MINENRIVPVTKSDLLSIYANMFVVADKDVTVLHASEIGAFSLAAELAPNEIAVCAEPVKTFDLNRHGGAGNIAFIPALDYDGFYNNGVKVVFDGDEVKPDGVTLYIVHMTSAESVMSKFY